MAADRVSPEEALEFHLRSSPPEKHNASNGAVPGVAKRAKSKEEDKKVRSILPIPLG
jgi:hypothetical protein